ncbi:hypothetical protein [Brevifollis gellanilyticus]|uniref:O-antigen polymerase n=1 Tax=Brevifollis gellanilyticus TaxID=748831 RepID=A0A512MCW8_9BACT|nr:hypothetical protein [Brevifollis gellanilyticus]GEP44584.1 hypothetical protein BGE01nite_38750 [Brevifollis gellanilyticus]
MNDGRGTNPFSMMLGLGLALYAIISVTLTQGNSISELCLMLMLGGLLLSLTSPRLAFTAWIITSGYIDLVKRLMVLSGRVSQSDLYYVLGIHPLMLGGITISLIVGAMLGRHRLRQADLLRFIAALMFMGLAALVSWRENGLQMGTVMADVANSGFYAMLLFVVPLLIKDLDAVLRLLRLVVIAYTPVAVYGIIQQIVGFQDFEIEYLLTGLSIEIKQLLSNEVRAFSTLNSPTALGFGCGACLIFCYILGWHRDQKAAQFRFPKLLIILMMAAFLGGLASATMRSAFVLVPVGLLGSWLFSSRIRTRVFYMSMVIGFVALVISSKWMLQVLPQAMAAMGDVSGDSVFMSQMLRVGTYYERLMGFSNCLANPAAYTLTGFGAERGRDYGDEFMNHDPLSNILIRYGAPALFLTLFSIWMALRVMHRSVLSLPEGGSRRTAALLLSVPLGYMVASVLQGSVFGTFPLNLLAYLCLGLIQSLGRSMQPEASQVPAAPHMDFRPPPRSMMTQPRMLPRPAPGSFAAGRRPFTPP